MEVIHVHQHHRKIIKVYIELQKNLGDINLYLRKGSQESSSSQGSDLNKSKGGDKKQRSTSTDDTNQPGKERMKILKMNILRVCLRYHTKRLE
jgi:hypothetical protein